MSRGLSSAVRDLFDAKASQWTQAYRQGGPLAGRTDLFVAEVAELRPPPGQVLDFGCGTGHIAKALADRGYTVVGVDMSTRMVEEGKRLFGDALTLTALPSDWISLPLTASSFDVVVASSVFEYVDNPDTVLRELARVLRPRGLLALTVPNMAHPRRWLEEALARAFRPAVMGRLVGRFPRLGLYARFLRTSRARFSRRGWVRRFQAAGFSVERVGPAASPMLLLFSLTRC